LDLTASEYLDWCRFAGEHGLGTGRDDIFWGMWLAMYANAHRPEHRAPYEVYDFLPYHKEPVQSTEQVERNLRNAFTKLRALGMGGKPSP
jgi:hypothetical protein